MEGNDLISVISFVIAVGMAVYTVATNRDRKKWENLSKAMLRNLAGTMELVRTNPRWADGNFKKILKIAVKLADEVPREEICIAALAGARDVTAAERMLRVLRNDVLAMQEGLYGTRDITEFDIPNKNPTFGDEEANRLADALSITDDGRRKMIESTLTAGEGTKEEADSLADNLGIIEPGERGLIELSVTTYKARKDKEATNPDG